MMQIVFEGISGAGKSEQAQRLKDRLLDEGYRVAASVHTEPTDWYISQIRKLTVDPKVNLKSSGVGMLALRIADRYLSLAPMLRRQFERGNIVVSDRSYISSMVYESEIVGIDAVYAMHAALPQPDVIFWMDVTPEIAKGRIDRRGLPPGTHETIEELQKGGQNYFDALDHFNYFNDKAVIRIDADLSVDLVAQDIWNNCMDEFANQGVKKRDTRMTPNV